MDITPLISSDRQVIQKYGADGFKISGKVYPDAVIVTPSKNYDWSHVRRFSDLSEESFSLLIDRADELDVVLLGTGTAQQFLPPVLRQSLRDKGLIVEVMDTGAACRTYNVLLADGRRVAAALMPL